ncbi:MAG: glycosyltransferase family 2 protein [Candidatus Micrarchaeaceae archaeon]
MDMLLYIDGLVALFYAYIAFLFLAWALLIFSNVVKFYAHAKPKVTKADKGKRLKALVILPCKGTEIDMEKGIESLKDQDYGKDNYDIIAVVDSESDGALPIIKQSGIKYMISDYKCSKCSGKVRAIASAASNNRQYDVFVIADSDIYCKRDWLRMLVEPLKDDDTGVSTAFPLFDPTPKSGFWAKVKMLWGFVGDGLMESEITRFAWGGSMAFRSTLLDDKGIKFFSKNISDDIAITKLVRARKQKVYYVSKRVVYVPSDDNFSKFMEWSNRQTALTLLGYKETFLYGMLSYVSNILLLITGIVLAIYYSPYMAILLLPFFLSLARTYARAEKRGLYIAAIFPLMNFIYIANLLAARRKEGITWRGSQYKLKP